MRGWLDDPNEERVFVLIFGTGWGLHDEVIQEMDFMLEPIWGPTDWNHLSVRAEDPIWMLTAPIPATAYALKRAGMKLEDIDLVEINEAFAAVPMAWLAETGYPHEKTNVNGGAIALGHPLGATGTKLMTTLLHELERTGGRYGLQTMCEGGGQANVTIIERL